MTNTNNNGLPCAYGGLIYARNQTSVRIWRPDYTTGAAICISDSMGHGTNSQASQNGELLFRVFRPPNFRMCLLVICFCKSDKYLLMLNVLNVKKIS